MAENPQKPAINILNAVKNSQQCYKIRLRSVGQVYTAKRRFRGIDTTAPMMTHQELYQRREEGKKHAKNQGNAEKSDIRTISCGSRRDNSYVPFSGK